MTDDHGAAAQFIFTELMKHHASQRVAIATQLLLLVLASVLDDPAEAAALAGRLNSELADMARLRRHRQAWRFAPYDLPITS